MSRRLSPASVYHAGATPFGRPFFVQVCQGVAHAHQKGLMHRDLKPSSVLVTTHDEWPW
jgi:serine/threonine protein kinase